MPLYEYACQSCGTREERLESMSAPSTHACPACGTAEAMTRQLSVAAVASVGGTGSFAPGGGCATGACPFA